MADMGLGSGFAAGAGADALQAQLTQLFQQAVAKQHMAQEQQRIQIEQQNANDNSAYRRMQEQDRADALKAASAQKGAAEGLQFATTLPEGTRLSQSGLAKLGAAGMNGPEFVQHTDPTLASRNIEGAGQAGTTAPVAALKIASVLNPGSPEQNTFLGTAARQAANQARQDALAKDAQARQDKIDAAKQAAIDKIDQQRQAQQGREDLARVAAGLKPAPSTAAADNRAQQSYQYHATALEKLRTPVEATAAKISDLNDQLSAGTPQADALVAPKLLSVLVGGQGSGLRMNEAEIARVVGGRSKWQDLQASIQKWNLDPTKANSITPEQRVQIHQLVDAVAKKNAAELSVLDDAGGALATATDPMQHRAILNDTHKKLSTLATGGTAGVSTGAGTGAAQKVGDTKTFPNGRVGKWDGAGWVPQ